MTSTLYYDDPNLLEFDATVVSLAEHEGHPAVVLDRSAFYPEGGGQPADRGEIGGVPVVDVRKDDGTIRHLLSPDADTEALKPAATVRCRVDATRRRDYQQQHSGQHVLSAVLMEVGGYETVSVHQGIDHTTLEVDADSIPPADLEAVERLANAAIEADLPLTAEWATDETIGDYPLRRPPKVSGAIRVVRVGEVDCVACGGVHVNRTGEIRLVRAIGIETIRGRARIAWKIGDRAIAHYRTCSDIVSRLGASLSARTDELIERVAKQDERTRELEAQSRRLAERVHTLVAGDLLSQASEVSRANESGGRRVVTAAFDDESANFLRGVTEQLVAQSGVAACLVNQSEGRLQWSIGIAPDSPVALDDLRGDLLPIIDGKGGGKPPIWQGIGTKLDGVEGFLARFREVAERALGTQPG